MQNLSLRLRIFLFFCLLAVGSLAFVGAGLFMGYRQLGDPAALSPIRDRSGDRRFGDQRSYGADLAFVR